MFNMAKASLIMFFLFLGIVFIAQKASAEEPKSGVELQQFNNVDTTIWGSPTPDCNLCLTGKRQSPINLETKKKIYHSSAPFKVVYNINNATLYTNGLVVQLTVMGKSELTIEDKTYLLHSLRWHIPSEHTINGVNQAAEMQQMFIETGGKLGEVNRMIIATLFKIGESDPLIDALQPEMAKLVKEMNIGKEGQDCTVKVPNFRSDLLQRKSSLYMNYLGSLTTPPCTENVIWTITSMLTMTEKQVSQLDKLLSKNNKNSTRPAQPLNSRYLWANRST